MLQYRALILLFCITVYTHADSLLIDRLHRLKAAYPALIIDFDEQYIVWHDATLMPIWDENPDKSAQEKLDNPSLADQLLQSEYVPGVPVDTTLYAPLDDPGRTRYEPFFRKMYGNSMDEVKNNLVPITWMPTIFGPYKHILLVTTVNDVHKKMLHLSQELEALVLTYPHYSVFLDNPAGTFCWRPIANTNRLSAHSFGMTIDINVDFSHYWQWDLKDKNIPVAENAQLTYHNFIPWEIVLIFEKHGFIWGGKWYHYDTMHFEYRPELFNTNTLRLATHCLLIACLGVFCL